MVPRSISGTPKRRQNTPEDGIAGGYAEIAPQGQFQSARNRIAFHRRQDRFRQQHARGSHWSVTLLAHTIAAALGERLEIGARAERASRTGKNRNPQFRVPVEPLKGLHQRFGSGGIYGIARCRTVDGHHRGLFADLEQNGSAHGLRAYFPLMPFSRIVRRSVKDFSPCASLTLLPSTLAQRTGTSTA